MKLFVYLSEYLGKPVVDKKGQFVGKLSDMSMHLNDEVFPRAKDLFIVKGLWNKKEAIVSFNDMKDISERLQLNFLKEELDFKKQVSTEGFSLTRDVLDQQVVDTQDRKVVRVNDVHLLKVENKIYLAHVDVGLRGLFRRLGWTGFVDMIVKLFNAKASYLKEESLISWKNTQVLTIGGNPKVLRSGIARQKFSRIPTAELADILEDLDVFERITLFKTFSVDMQRKIFTDMTPQEKEELIDQLEDDEASNLVENIPADEATDLLNQLPKEKVMKLMHFMQSESSKRLRKLLGFAQDSAGGLMTTEYLSVKQNVTVSDALVKIKNNVDYSGNIFFIYIVDDDHRLIGTTSLRRFINEDPSKLLYETCYPNKIFVRTDDGMEEVALLLEKYKFSSIPVLNEGDVLQGVITSDDVLEELISLTWTKYKDQL